MTAVYKGLLETATDPSSQAQLLAARSRESGAWLHTLPMSSLGLQMDNEVILHLPTSSIREVGAVACQAECRKQVKYAELTATHHFVPMAIDTTGVFGLEARSFLSELGTGRDGRLLPATTYCSGLQWQYRGQCCCSAGHVVSGQRLVRPVFTQKACDRRDLLAGITICFLGTLLLGFARNH